MGFSDFSCDEEMNRLISLKFIIPADIYTNTITCTSLTMFSLSII